MSYYKSLEYGARLHCKDCGHDEPVEAEEAWWDGSDLHLLHGDGTEVVIKNAEEQGFVKEEVG